MENSVNVPQTLHSYLEIDLRALRNNAEYLKDVLPDGIRQMAVVKSNAYGHGAVEISRELEGRVSWLAVAHVYEAIELRQAGIRLPILVFGVPVEETASLYSEWDLTAVVSDLNHFNILPEGTKAHLQFDTGMSRLGIRPEQANDALEEIKKEKLSVSGVMSHLACADDTKSPKTKQQIELAKSLFSGFPDDYDRHIHNTAGLLYHFDPAFTLVRHGIGMYGYDPAVNPKHNLEPVLTWKSRVMQTKPVKKGETISYGAKWQADRDGRLLVVPVGYSDGLPRNMTDKVAFKLNGKEMDVKGVVTMEYTMLFTDHFGEDGDEVTVFGKHDNDVRLLSDAANTITYELLTRIPAKIPRYYLNK